MEVVKEILSPCQVSLLISVEPAKVAEAVNKAYHEFSKYVQVPGFRKGKAPLSFVKSRVPDAQLRERTAELLVSPAYKDALEKESVEPYAEPELELVNLEIKADEQKFEFKAVVPLAPKVELGKYVGVPVNLQKPKVDNEVLDQLIKRITESAATYPLVTDRPARIGDILATETAVTAEGDDPAEPVSRIFEVGDETNSPGLNDQLVGLSVGDDKSFILIYPEDWREEDWAGKTAGYFVTVKAIHEKKIPEFDEAFVKSRLNADSVEQGRQILHDRYLEDATNRASRAAEFELLNKIIEASQIDFPNVMLVEQVREEVRSLIENLSQSGIELNDYLERRNTTEEAIAKEAEVVAERKIRNTLVLAEVARRENLKVEQADFDREIAAFAAEHNVEPAAYLQYAQSSGHINVITNAAFSKKVLGFLLEKAIIDEVEASASSSDADAAGAELVATPEVKKAPARKSRAKKPAEEPAQE